MLIPVFNGGRFLDSALASIVEQAPAASEMEIVVVDDASTDIDVAALVRGVGGGRVDYFRQAENIGSVRNFNFCLARSRGTYVHLLHADDRVLPGFYAAIDGLAQRFPRAGAYFSRIRYVDEMGQSRGTERAEAPVDGYLEGWLERIASEQTIQYAGIAVRRDVYEAVGGFYGVTYGEDWEMWIRIAARFPMAYTPQVLAEYRIHSASISGPKLRTAENLKDLAWVIETSQRHLPPGSRPRVRRDALRLTAYAAVHEAQVFWRRAGDRSAAVRQISGAVRLHFDLPLGRRILRLLAEMRPRFQRRRP